jgi:hypothetical protein
VKKFKDDPDAESTTRPAKKRKLEPEIRPKRGSSTGSKGKQLIDEVAARTVRKPSLPAHEVRPGRKSLPRAEEHEDSSDDEVRFLTPVAPPNVKDKGKGKARPDSDSEVEVISVKSSSSVASERIQEMLDVIPADSDVDDVGDPKKERNDGAAGRKPQVQKGRAGSTAKSEVWVYDKRGNIHSGEQKPNTEADVAELTSAKPNPRSRPKGKEKDSRSRSHTPILSPGAHQRLEEYDREVLVVEEPQGQPIITSKPKTPPAAEREPGTPLFLAITPEPDYHYEQPEPGENHYVPSVLDRDEQGGGLEDGDLQDDESTVGELTYPDQMQIDHPDPVQPEEEIIPAKPTATTSKPNSVRRGQTPEDLPGRVADIILRARTNNPRIRKEPTLPEIIPETETESNRNTESQDSQPQPQPQEKASVVVPLAATRSERLISKMMPRSPHSRGGGSRVSVIDEERFGTPFETPYEDDDDDDPFNQDDTDLSPAISRKAPQIVLRASTITPMPIPRSLSGLYQCYRPPHSPPTSLRRLSSNLLLILQSRTTTRL